MSDNNPLDQIDSVEAFLNSRNQKLNQTIEDNNARLNDLLDRRSSRINSVVEDVYKDLFGADFLQKYNTDPSADETEALKNAINNVMTGGVDILSANSSAGNAGSSDAGHVSSLNADPISAGAASASAAPAAEADSEKPAEAQQAEEAKEEVPEKSALEELNELTGLENVKHDVKELIALMKVQKMREENGMKFVPTSLHLVFAGNPGTGKTTVARILARLYKEIGVLSKGQLIEVDRSGLVAGYVGQTALKTQEKIEAAKGGILFVDEAYALNKEGQDYGQEAIDTILKAMEDNRKDFVVIVAGYTDLMERFVNSNPGLKSRFNKYIYFQDYTADELMGIFEQQCSRYSYKMTDETREKVCAILTELEAKKDSNFANARDVRNLFETIITNQASRVAAIDAPSVDDLLTLLPEDLEDEV